MRYKDSTKADEMRRHVEACQAGSLTVQQYCKEHGLAKSAYYYWYKRLQKPLEPKTFVALNLNGVQGGGVVVSFPNGVSIRFNSGVAASVLKELACCI